MTSKSKTNKLKGSYADRDYFLRRIAHIRDDILNNRKLSRWKRRELLDLMIFGVLVMIDNEPFFIAKSNRRPDFSGTLHEVWPYFEGEKS